MVYKEEFIMKKIEIKAETRKEIGTNKVKKLRKTMKVPIIIYGDGSIPLTIDYSDALKIYNLRHNNFLIKLSIDGGKEKNALLKNIQLDPVRNEVTHLDFMELIEGRTISTKIPLHLEGTPEGIKMGGIVEHFLWDVNIECLPKDIPEQLKLDISNLNIGDSIHVSDLKLAEGIRILDNDDQVILTIGLPTGMIEEKEEVEEELEEGVEGEEVAEGEEAKEGAEKAEAKEEGKEKKEPAEGKEKGKKMTPEELEAARRTKRKTDHEDKKKKK